MNNSFDCTWELLTAKCIDSDLAKDTNDMIVNNSLINQCPRYNVSTKEIFVYDGDSFILGNKDRVIIRTVGLKSHIQKYFRCALTLTNSSIITSFGKLINDLIVCDPFQVRITIKLLYKLFNLNLIRIILDFLRKRCWPTKFIICTRLERV